MKKRETITIDSDLIPLPKKWSELTADQVLFIAKEKYTAPSKEIFMTNSLVYLLGFKPAKGVSMDNGNMVFTFVKNKQRYHMDALTAVALFEKIQWLNDAPEAMECPQFDCVKSPHSQLYGISLEQFLKIDRLYCDFIRTKDVKVLDPFFASLFKGKNGYKKVSEIDKFAVVFWYTGLKTWLKEKYEYVFSQSSENYTEDEFEETPVEEYLMSIVASLNEGRPADNEAIKAGEVHGMLFDLNRKIEFSENQKQK